MVDSRGRVVGINTAIIGDSYQGISFSIPSSIARKVYQELKQEGSVARGWLGVALDSVDSDRASQLGVHEDSGALVWAVIESSPAVEAGVQSGDVIIEWAGKKVDKPETLSIFVAETEVGSQVEVIVKRGGTSVRLEVTVARRSDETQ